MNADTEVFKSFDNTKSRINEIDKTIDLISENLKTLY